jgi:endonuclease/exonuclease/phosphatase family metal-dependent hydrolase
MRVITWNMGCAYERSKYRANHAEAWSRIERLDPDVALLQEVGYIPQSIDPERVVATPRNPDSTFLTVVYARRGKVVRLLTDPSLSTVVRGQAVVAEVSGASVHPVVFASVHTLTGLPSAEAKLAFEALATDGRLQLSTDTGSWHPQVILQAVDQHVGGRRFVVGGDFNVAWRFDEEQGSEGGYWASAQFQAARSKGWRRCHLKFHAGEERTFFRGARELYQLDHIFADKITYDAASRCDVLQMEDQDRLSDHAPMILEVEEPNAATESRSP